MSAPALHFESLAPESWELALRLGRAIDDDYYLAGSAALALYLGHRRVRGLDFMSAVHRLLPPERRDLLQCLLGIDPAVRVETARDGFLALRFGVEDRTITVRFFYYPYPLAAPLDSAEPEGLQVASLLDLALMKLGAIISRGSRRDFVDLYLLSQRLPLPEVLEASGDKFGHVRDFPLQAAKALADTSQWNDEPLPALSRPLDDTALTQWLEEEIARFLQEIAT